MAVPLRRGEATPENTTDLQMMQSPNLWPIWPHLPLKRKVEGKMWPEHGFLFQPGADGIFWFYFGSMFASHKEAPLSLDSAGLESLVADGWVVD
jgi:hypothetical protein